jgi:uncharacterized protein (DUF305 family)
MNLRILLLTGLTWHVTGCAGAPADRAADAAPRTVQPGAPGQATRMVSATELGVIQDTPYTEADVRFMQGMIPHHAQALEMAALVAERSRSRELHLLSQRVEISQRDEIALMERWLRARGEATSMMMDELMPGMLTEAEMRRLGAAREDDFDRLWLELMIKHHEGAVAMVATLFASAGAGQESQVFQFASHVEADQQMEILRMRRMLEEGRDR